MAEKSEEVSKKAQQRNETSKRQREIARLWFKGLTKEEIAEKTSITQRQVSEDLKFIRLSLQPRTIRSIEYYRNKSRARLDMIRQKAWELVEAGGPIKDGARVAALRLVREVEDLQTKVDGIVTDKLGAGPDKRAEELQRKLVAIASQKDKGNGHDKEEDALVKDAVTDKGAEEANSG